MEGESLVEEIIITVNGNKVRVKERFFTWPLVRFLREELHLTGTKQGIIARAPAVYAK